MDVRSAVRPPSVIPSVRADTLRSRTSSTPPACARTFASSTMMPEAPPNAAVLPTVTEAIRAVVLKREIASTATSSVAVPLSRS